LNGRTIAAVQTLLLTNVGGSQIRDLRETYPKLHKRLSQSGIQLILIADGPGFLKVQNNLLREVFQSVYKVLTIDQANSNELIDALLSAATINISIHEPIDRIIESLLTSGQNVKASRLPLPHDNARLALAEYIFEITEFSS
jgi:hypothetical protein